MKKYIAFIIISIAFSGCTNSNSSQDNEIPAEKGGYALLWHDEFNTDGKPDTSYWSYEKGFVRNEELQWYQEDNASIKNGVLVIEGKREKIKNPGYDSTSNSWRNNRAYAEYSSSSIHTRGKMTFQYGIMEVRAKIDTAKGLWPAIWTLGTTKGWPSNGEIDIMEFYRSDDKPVIMANAAWGDHWRSTIWDSEKISLNHFLEKDTEWPQNFHTWKMEWTEDYIKLFLDDELLNEVDLSQTINGDGFNPFHQPHYILLNLALGSNGGDPSGTQFPKIYEVDYVRIYSKKPEK